MAKAATKEVKDKKTKTPRAPSPYNMFMKTELPKLKKELPGMNHRELFTKAASNWKNAPENPKNKKK